MTNHLKDLLSVLARENVNFIVCGGVAVVLHGVERMTLDLDISVDMDHDNVHRFLSVMKSEKMTPRAPIPAETLLDSERVKKIVSEKNAFVFTFLDLKNPYRQIDVFLTADYSYRTLRGHTMTLDVDGHSISILTKEKLLEMKRSIHPPRDKDLADIKALERLACQS